MQAVLLKPCIPSHLVAEVERVLGRPSRSTAEGSSAHRP